MSPDITEINSKPKLRWYTVRFSAVARGLGAFLILVLIVVLAGMAHERWATASVRAAGGTVWHCTKGWYIIRFGESAKGASILNPRFSRLNHLNGDIWLYLDGTDTTDEDLVYLESLERLAVLGLAETGVSDEGMTQIGRLNHLWELGLTGTKVTDDGIFHLAELHKLRKLNLADTRVTDKCLVRLSSLPELGLLDLTRTEITDAGIPQLMRLKRLYWLNLEGTKVTDEGVKVLRQSLPSYCDIRK